MKKTIFLLIIAFFAIGIIIFLFEKSVHNNSLSASHGTFKVATTIFPLYDIVKNVAGDDLDVVLLLPSGASPHTFEPLPSTLKELSGSALLFAIGHGLDDWSQNMAKSANVPIVTVDKGIALRKSGEEEHGEHENEHGEHNHGAIDPHYWLSLTNAAQIAHTIAEELAHLDSEHASFYMKRADLYGKNLLRMRDAFRERLQSLPNRNIIALHDAWGYFADEFGLNVVGTFESAAGTQPSPRDIEMLAKKVKEYNVSILFSEPQLSTDAITSFARDHNLTIAIFDPLGGIDGRMHYTDLMRYNINNVINALKK